MSVYATEILGYTTELWETPPPYGQPDPIRVLYARHAPLLEGIVGTTALRRAQVVLSEILPPGVLDRRF